MKGVKDVTEAGGGQKRGGSKDFTEKIWKNLKLR